MQEVSWRRIPRAANTFAVLSAACMEAGFRLVERDFPTGLVTCYSLNSTTYPRYRDEIRTAPAITIAGGPHPSACPGEVLEVADYVVVGEGEFTLPSLLASIYNGTGHIPTGVATTGHPAVPDHTVYLPAYPPFGERPGFVEITRGCPHHCGYCQTPSLFGCHMRHRPVDQVVEYAARYRDARFLSPNAMAYGSDGRTMRLSKVELLLRSLRNPRIYFGTFPSEVRPEFVTGDSIDLIRRYCANTRLHFGAQSGSDRVLSAIGRGHDTSQVIAAVDHCRDGGLIPVVDFILGLPGETPDDQEATLSLIREICHSGCVHVHRFTPLPGTAFARAAMGQITPSVANALGSLALSGKLTGRWSFSMDKVL